MTSVACCDNSRPTKTDGDSGGRERSLREIAVNAVKVF